MSSTTCDQVAERVALGEPLDEVGEHAATCERCKRLVALPVEIGATRREADPGLGFTARMTAGAQHRITVRRRRRIAATMAAAVAATTLGVFVMTRDPAPPQTATSNPTHPVLPAIQSTEDQDDPWNRDDSPGEADDVSWLVQIADTDHSRNLSANWRDIEQPLDPYRSLLRSIR
jgi:hypothetical protein